MEDVSTYFARLREAEFARLDRGGHAYLDYTGSGLYAASQIRSHAEHCLDGVFGNPHSSNPASLASTRSVERIRSRILSFFSADPDDYEVVFTCNATAALKIVAEGYPFDADARLLLTTDNHNSVNAIREFAIRRGTSVSYIPLDLDLRLQDANERLLPLERGASGLFGLPAQSNFSGVKHPLELLGIAEERGYDTVLDAAAFVPTNRLDLTQVRPSFVCISFYKMFGFPTGIGALIARRDALARLTRPWFGGGTVRFAVPDGSGAVREVCAEAFEDGTLNFLSICALESGLQLLSDIGMDRLNAHIMHLASDLLQRLQGLRHANGNPLVILYGPGDAKSRGATIAFNVLDRDGYVVDCKVVEQEATAEGISVRTGGFCNPGASEAAFHYAEEGTFQKSQRLCPDEFASGESPDRKHEKPAGAVRVSLGIASNRADVDRLIALLERFRDAPASTRQHTLDADISSV